MCNEGVLVLSHYPLRFKEGFFILLVECRNIKKYFGDRLILSIDKFRIYSEDRIGIIGVNGAGKTTLINILCQRIEPDEGWVKLYGKYAYISQLETSETQRLSPEMASQFGVSTIWDETMSGGEKTRFKLAESLSRDTHMLFADEPTSNMDLDGIELMENRFAEYQGGLILISHDRSFLDKLCNKILEIEDGKISLYRGNYSDYSTQKTEERERARFEYQQYVSEKKRLKEVTLDIRQKERSIKKTPKRMGNSEARLHKMGNQKAKANLDRARKSTETRIAHLEVKEKPFEPERIKLELADSEKLHSKVIIEGEKICKGFGEKVLLKDAEFKIKNGSKVALIGPNGCGKSTLLRMIMNQDPSIKIAPGAKVGYFSQDLSVLNENLTILGNVMEGSIYQETFARTLLAGLLFRREDVHKPVSVLSGGERVKVSFAKILLQDINLLILDEPTNYMDINSLEVIEEALQNYDKTLLFVSHDRSFIHSVANRIMTIEHYGIHMFNGKYEDYLRSKQQSPDHETEELKKQIFILQHRLNDVVGRLSAPSKKDNIEALDQEYYQILGELKRLKTCLENKSKS